MRRTTQEFTEPQHYDAISALASLTRVLVRLGLLDRERREFWRFVTQAMVRHRDRFAETLRLAAMGYHFRKLSELYGEG